MVYYEPIKIRIDILGLAKVIIDVVICHHRVPKLIVTDQESLFTSKFWSSLSYFLEIKRKLSIAFHQQTSDPTKRQNSSIEEYLRAFVNWEQNDSARLLPIAEFAYNNTNNTSTGHTPFKLNFGYYLKVSFKEDVNPHSKSRSADKLAEELRELMEFYC